MTAAPSKTILKLSLTPQRYKKMAKKRKPVPKSEYVWHASSFIGGFKFTSRKEYFDCAKKYYEEAQRAYAVGRTQNGHEGMEARSDIERECCEFAAWENSPSGQAWIAANWKDYNRETELNFLKEL